MRLLYTISLFFVPLYGTLHFSIKDYYTGNYCIILEVGEINGTISYEDLSGQSQLYNFSMNSIYGYTGSCNLPQFIGLIYKATQDSTVFSNSKFYRILSDSKFHKVTQNSAVLQNDPDEILKGMIFWIQFGQKSKKEAPSIVGEFFFNPDITKEIVIVNYTNIDYTVDWGNQGFSCPSQRWVNDTDYVEFNGLKVVAYANLTDDQIPHDQLFQTCDHIDEDSWNFILLLIIVLILVVILALVIACLCMTGACACFTQWIARLRSRDEELIANYD